MSARFFGHPESPIFGVYHAARGKTKRSGARSTPVRAAVICPPLGQEYIRTHWCLRLLANQLARAGVHVLRFDYHGIGDSYGSPEQIVSLADWHQNIAEAIQHLKQTSGAKTVMLIGQRMGGSLAAKVASQVNSVNSIVFWEPVTKGDEYLDELRSMHAEMLDLWVCKMETPNDEDVEEILGSQYRRELLNEIEAFSLDVNSIVQPQLIVDVENKCDNYQHTEPSLLKFIPMENEGSWRDLRVLETARLRPQATRTIVKAIGDMFDRLQKFDALTKFQFAHLANASFGSPEGVQS